MKRIFAHIGFSVAVSLVVLNLIGIEYTFAITVGLAVIFAASLVLPKFRQAMVVPVCVGSAIFACLIFMCNYYGTVAPQQELSHKTVNASFYIIDVCEMDEDSYNYIVKTTEIEEIGAPQNIKLKIKSPAPIEADDYQLINSRINLYPVGNGAFSSYGYWSKSLFLTGTLKEYSVTNERVNSPWKYVLSLRKDIVNTILNNVNGDSGSLAVALVTGNKSTLSEKCITNFRYAGASHLMAVSGFHLTVMVGALVFVMKRLRFKDRTISIISILEILVVIGIAGFSKSVIRAGIMMSVMLISKLVNRRSDGVNSLGIAVFIICLNPFAVADIGAQLSVISVLSLMTLQPRLLKLIYKDAVEDTDSLIISTELSDNAFLKLANLMLVSFSVLVYTMPVMYIHFGYVNIAGLLSNILLVPLGSLCIRLSFAAYISLKLHFLSSLFAGLCSYGNGILIWLVRRFAMMKNAVIGVDSVVGIVLAGIFVVLAFCFILNKLEYLKFVGAGALAIITILLFVSSLFNNSANVLICKSGALAIRNNNKIVVYNVDDKSDYYSVKQFLISSNCELDKIITPDGNNYSLKLANDFGCNTMVTSVLDDNVLKINNCNSVEYCESYDNNDSIGISYSKSYCVFDVNDVTIATGDNISANSNLVITDKTVVDDYGKIDLNNGDVVYTIKDSGLYSARRVDSWQK